MAEIIINDTEAYGSLIDDNQSSNSKTYSSDKINFELSKRANKATTGNSGEILIKDGDGNPVASGRTPSEFALSTHTHDATSMGLSTTNFDGFFNSSITNVQELADNIDDRLGVAGTGLTQTEIKTAYEANADTNAFTDSEKTKLAGLSSSVTSDNVSYDNTISLLSATDVKTALDEINSEKITKVTSTDNAIPRFDGVAGEVQDSGITISDTNDIASANINADNNTISNLEVDNLKTGVLDTDLSSVSVNDDTIASAKAIKTALDGKQDVGVSTGGIYKNWIY